MEISEGQEAVLDLVYNTLADIESGVGNTSAILLVDADGVLNVFNLNTPQDRIAPLIMGTLQLLSISRNIKEAN
jgi:hypothetical protein